MADFLVITGLSGAGRSQVAANLEDLGWFVIDNLPVTLLDKIAELTGAPGSTFERVALVVGRSAYQTAMTEGLAQLRATGHRVRIIFLDASTQELVRRYGATRRRHPYAEREGDSLSMGEAIELERELLEPVKAEADLVLDTTDLNVHQLKSRIVDLFSSETPAGGMQTTVTSFGFKHGLPLDVDLVLDCRFLPNPYWDEDLRPLSGQHDVVKEYVLTKPAAVEFLNRMDHLLDLLLPAYVAEGKSYLTIALGCTGGRHRSVAIAEELARRLRRKGYDPRVQHRDIDR
ncbi:MAG: RNase adapter RapZ [Acidimicrobiia bacterium]